MLGYLVFLDIDNTFTDKDIFLRESLKQAGFNSVKDLVIRGPVDIAKSAGIELEEAVIICNRATTILEEIGIISKSFSDYNGDSIKYIATGSDNLDKLFSGRGIETQSISEFYGSAGSGKTQLCHTLCVSMQNQSPEYKAIYIDTEGTFRPERVSQIASARGLDSKKILQNIKVARALNSARQESVLERECCQQIDKDDNIKLLIIDSLINHYRAEYSGRAMLVQRQNRLNKIMHLLQNIAQIYNIAVVITNQIHTSPDGLWRERDKPLGGNVIAHNVANRIHLTGCDSLLIAKIVKSTCHSAIDTRLVIDENGVTDFIDENENK